MSTIQVVAEKMAGVAKLTAGLIVQAAANLVGKAETLSLPEMHNRLDPAMAALRGEEAPASDAVPTVQKIALQVAQEMMESYFFNKTTGVSTFTVPAGVTDVEAMKALNEYFKKYYGDFKRDAIYAGDLAWFEKLPQKFPNTCQERDYSQARQVTITAVVKGTMGESRTTQAGVLKNGSLVFSDPRDQALAAAIHACKDNGKDLFKDLLVRGSVPGFVLDADWGCGVYVGRFLDVCDDSFFAASGSSSRT